MRPLQEYERKRDFKKTPEPEAVVKKTKTKASIFVVQEHHASHLHYDFRLEMEGVLKSWAIPKGPSLDPSIKRLAVEVEDHPISYAKFEGQIPAREYGGGDVFIWDHGTWEPSGDPVKALKKGKIEFTLKGEKLKGRWMLLRTRRSGSGGKPQWILIKRTDGYAAKEEAVPTKTAKKKSGAKDSEMGFPRFLDLELAELVEAPPQGNGWLHETKFDGYRTEARIDDGNVQLLTRTAQDWTHKYPTVARALTKLKAQNAILDGEIVWVDEKGRSDFQRLQNALKEKESSSIIYYVFDLLYLNGEDLRQLPLIERKKRLENLLSPLKGTAVLFSDHVRGEAEEFLEAACDYQLEGIVSKRVNSPYLAGRSDNWVKSKCKQRQEFVIGGFTEGEGSRAGFGALLLGVFDQNKLQYVGRVGTGFNQDSLLTLRKRLSALETKRSPFALRSPKTKGIHWVRPELVAEINFANWTDDGILRVPVFQGLREDKPVKTIRREQAAPTPKSNAPPGITHPDKVLFAKEGITKLQVAEYYEAVSEWMLPHLSDRPLTLVRCPEGTNGQCFYQKHGSSQLPESVERIRIQEKTGIREYMTVDSVAGIQALIQQGTIEFHGWNCRKQDVDHPDQIVLDFDPGPGVSWKQVVQGALDMKGILDQLDLKSFAKVTGSKGIHVHVPLGAAFTWEQIKNYSLSLAQEIVSRQPELFTVTLSKSARRKKTFIDYLRNSESATAIVPYSLRAKEVSAVAMPLEWGELQEIEGSNSFTIEKALLKIKNRKSDPWKDFLLSAQKIPLLPDESQKEKKKK